MSSRKRASDAISLIVSELMCIGCGLCAASCREDAIALEYVSAGLFQARVTTQCKSECGRCARVCPFSDATPDEDELSAHHFGDGLARSAELGAVRGCYVVKRPSPLRIESASGGAVTWLVETLLERGIVSHAACVAANGTGAPRFHYVSCTDSSSVRACSGSAYAAVNVDDVVTSMREQGGTWVIVAVPCVAKGLRALSQLDARIAESLTVLVGLTCGQTKTDRFPDWIRLAGGIKPGNEVRFRIKDETRPADDFALVFDDEESTRVYWREDVAPVWHSRLFTPPACGVCDDVFAETADMVAMDAWLPEYVNDWKGTSLVAARSELTVSVLQDLAARHPGSIMPTTVRSLVRSQSGAIHEKRVGLRYRLFLRRRNGRLAPRKRLTPARTGSILDRAVWRVESAAGDVSFTEIGEDIGSRDARHLCEHLVACSVQRRTLRRLAGALRSKARSLVRRIAEGFGHDGER